MFLIRLFHFLAGYVRFSAKGGFPERFINLCTAMGISVWDLQPGYGILYGSTKISSYRKLRHAAKKSGVRIRLVAKKGLPFFLKRHHQHMGLAIGAVVFVAVLGLLSGRIWVIQIENCRTISEDTIRSSLQELGIYEGMRSKTLKASGTERQMVSRVHGLSWIALNMDGSVLHVEIREDLQTEPPEEYETPCHIVAGKDGFLRKVEDYEGKAMVQPRTAVQKGQLLISGITDNKDGSVCVHHAKGKVEAETNESRSVTTPKAQAFPTVLGSGFRVELHLFRLSVPLGRVKPQPGAEYFCYDIHFTAGEYRLPLSCTIRRNLFFGNEHTLSEAESRLLCLSDFSENAANELWDCRILSQTVTVTQSKAALIAHGEYKLLEEIGVEQPILLEE